MSFSCYSQYNEKVNKDNELLFVILRRKNIGVKAAEYWKGQHPKFNTPERKLELKRFAEDNLEEYGMPEVGFFEEGIMKHVQSFFSEQRRYKKRTHSKVHVGTFS